MFSDALLWLPCVYSRICLSVPTPFHVLRLHRVTMDRDAEKKQYIVSVTCGLTTEDRDQLRNPTLVSCMGPYLTQQAVREAAPICPRPCKLTFDLFDLESGVGYLCANFNLPRPLCSRLRPDVNDRRQTSDAHHRLMPPTLGGVSIKTVITCLFDPFVVDTLAVRPR